MEKLSSLGIHFPERRGMEFLNLFLPGLGAEVQVEKGAGKGKGYGIQAGSAQDSISGEWPWPFTENRILVMMNGQSL